MNGQRKPLNGNQDDQQSKRRWWFSVLVVGSFCAVCVGILVSIHVDNGNPVDPLWKELLLLMLGALIGNFGKVVDFWFTRENKNYK